MMSCLTEHGRVGLTAVGDSPAQADALYRQAERILLDEAADALREAAIPSYPSRGLNNRPITNDPLV